MKKKLFLHIGFHKTGTSALQEYLDNHREELERQDIFYPRSHDDAFPGNVDLSWAFNNNPPRWGNVDEINREKILDFYKKQLLSTGCKNIIISSEDFVLLDSQIISIEKIKEYLREYEVKLVVYMREPVEFMLSLYSHAIRARQINCSFKTYIAENYNFAAAFYPARLQPWIKVFGKESLIVRKYEKKSFINNSLLEDFFDAIGIKIRIKDKMNKSNVGVHPWLIQAYIDIASSDIDEKVKVKKLKQLLRVGVNLPKENAAKFLLDEQDLAIINNVYKTSKNKLRQDFGIEF
ncbi:hypothetical protein [Sulfurovum sp. NBC37-1]|uniref:hypothetical protein n=1 Tax=Sulfurovum sp. (strain NBC37-1) TaxID=387093 RepID=UPI0001587965|nr:hypothetical protein [Sulfurovum sp. NBC37-1]BAF72679.1 hypothetical protein SUN_1732 [Sulfurovum sp. NBC37-1]